MNSWEYQRRLFKQAISCNNIVNFLNQYEYQIDIDCFGKYCIDINDVKLFRGVTKLITPNNLTSWLIYAIQIDKPDILEHLIKYIHLVNSDDVELIICTAVKNDSIHFLNNLTLYPMTIIKTCIEYNKPIIFNPNSQDHHFYIVMFALMKSKFDIVRDHILLISDKDYLQTIRYFIQEFNLNSDIINI